MSMTVNDLCRDIMSDTKLPMSKRLELVREVRAKAKPNESAKGVVKTLASTYMGYAWARSTGANKLVGAYLGYLLSKKL